MGKLANDPNKTTQVALGYNPTALESYSAKKIDERFESSSKYWKPKHDMQKRLMARYLNAKMQEKNENFSNIQLGRLWYICDIIESLLAETLLNQRPFGRIAGQGIEDFPGAQAINEVNGHQQEQRYLKNAHRDSLLHSVITGTGVKALGWEYYIQTYFDKQEKMLRMVNPADPANPIEIPTGEYEMVQKQEVVDRLSCIRIDSWLTFPPAGGVNPAKDPYWMFLVKYNKSQLKEMEATGFIENVDYIAEAAYGTKKNDRDIGDYYIDKAKKEEGFQELDKESIWLIFYFGLSKYSNDGTEPAEGIDEEPVFMIKPKYDENVMLKLVENPYPAIPCVRDRYSGTDDEWYGRSFTEIIEKLLKLDEDMYGYVQDAARRELFRRTYVSDKMDTSTLTPRTPDQIVPVPDALMAAGKIPFEETPNPHLMPNMQEQRRINTEILDEIPGALDFVRGGDVQEEEKATMTTQRVNFLNRRFKNRMTYYEDHGLHEWMEWQCVLNHRFLPPHVVSEITGKKIWPNPFQMLEPTIPMQTFDFVFEGATKAAENPVLAQIYKQMLEVASGIGPGLDEQGRLVQPNLMAIFRQFVKKTTPDEDIDEFFMPAIGLAPGMSEGASQGGLGAVTPGDLLPNQGAGIRPETR